MNEKISLFLVLKTSLLIAVVHQNISEYHICPDKRLQCASFSGGKMVKVGSTAFTLVHRELLKANQMSSAVQGMGVDC